MSWEGCRYGQEGLKAVPEVYTTLAKNVYGGMHGRPLPTCTAHGDGDENLELDPDRRPVDSARPADRCIRFVLIHHQAGTAGNKADYLQLALALNHVLVPPSPTPHTLLPKKDSIHTTPAHATSSSSHRYDAAAVVMSYPIGRRFPMCAQYAKHSLLQVKRPRTDCAPLV